MTTMRQAMEAHNSATAAVVQDANGRKAATSVLIDNAVLALILMKKMR